MSRAVIYVRVSTEEQAEKGFSLQAQREECARRARELGCSASEIYEYSDEGISGSILERPSLMAALDRLAVEAIDYLICLDSSRLSRNVSHQLIIIDQIKKCGTQLIFLKNSYEDTAEGRFQLTVMAAVDEYERARFKLRSELGKRTKASQHKLTHNPGLYGYDFDKDTDSLYINQSQANTLKQMFQWLIEENMSFQAIAQKLNQVEIPSPRGKQWSRNTVRRILMNSSYTGTLYIRRYDTRDYKFNKFKKTGEKQKIKEKPQEQWIPVQIPSIIDMQVFQKAQDKMQKNKRLSKNTSEKPYLLSGLLTCGLCGSPITGRFSQKNKNGTILRYYACTSKYPKNNSSFKCSQKLINAELLEKAVWNLIADYLWDPLQIQKQIHVNESKQTITTQNQIQKVQQELEALSKERERVITLFQKGIITEKNLTTKLNEIQSKMNKLTCHCQILKSEQQKKQCYISSKQITNQQIVFVINSLNINQKTLIIDNLIKNISITDNDVKVYTALPSYIISGFHRATTLVGDVPQSYITVPEDEINNFIPAKEPDFK